jgi:hypothetical protein
MVEGLDERVLHSLFGVFRISQDGYGYAKDAAFMLAHESFEGPAVSREHTINQEEIILRPMVFGVPAQVRHRV